MNDFKEEVAREVRTPDELAAELARGAVRIDVVDPETMVVQCVFEIDDELLGAALDAGMMSNEVVFQLLRRAIQQHDLDLFDFVSTELDVASIGTERGRELLYEAVTAEQQRLVADLFNLHLEPQSIGPQDFEQLDFTHILNALPHADLGTIVRFIEKGMLSRVHVSRLLESAAGLNRPDVVYYLFDTYNFDNQDELLDIAIVNNSVDVIEYLICSGVDLALESEIVMETILAQPDRVSSDTFQLLLVNGLLDGEPEELVQQYVQEFVNRGYRKHAELIRSRMCLLQSVQQEFVTRQYDFRW